MNSEKKHYPLIVLVVLIGVLSISAQLVNRFIYHFSGNNYFPNHITTFALILVLFYLGLMLMFGLNSKQSNSGLELLYFFAVMSVVAFATNAAQLTPFNPIDQFIINYESHIGINMELIVAWISQYAILKRILIYCYNSIDHQMVFVPLFVIAMGRFKLMKQYYFLMLFTVLIGFTFYYFFPTTAPASMIKSPFFSPDQVATGLKFNQIHQHLDPTTIAGGLIAFPSFHVIWSLLCVYLLQEWIYPCIALLLLNIGLILSCVLLGWHYPSDIIGGLILLALAYRTMRFCRI